MGQANYGSLELNTKSIKSFHAFESIENGQIYEKSMEHLWNSIS